MPARTTRRAARERVQAVFAAALASHAAVETAGRCPPCGSTRGYLESQATQAAVRSLHGPLVLHQQHAWCRACGGSFSPSGS